MLAQTLYIMQGVPGSGKSTIAHRLCALVCSTDDYFMEYGEYKFNPTKLAYYHSLNIEKVIRNLDKGLSVVVDNTNIKKIHAKPYIDAAKARGIPVVIIRCHSKFQSIHNVPLHKLCIR